MLNSSISPFQRPSAEGSRSRRTLPATSGQISTSLLMRSAAIPSSGHSPLMALRL